MATRKPDACLPGLSDEPREMPKSRQKRDLFWFVPDAFEGKTLDLPSSGSGTPRRGSEANNSSAPESAIKDATLESVRAADKGAVSPIVRDCSEPQFNPDLSIKPWLEGNQVSKLRVCKFVNIVTELCLTFPMTYTVACRNIQTLENVYSGLDKLTVGLQCKLAF